MITTAPWRAGAYLFAAALVLTCAVYWPGLGGSWFFDDYPNIVDNTALRSALNGFNEFIQALLSSPASNLKRPLASFSFVLNYAVSGFDAFGWKLTNLAIHLLNGLLVYRLAQALTNAVATPGRGGAESSLTAAAIAAAWLLLPINLTAVLFVVQRMESLANLFVLLGLLGYLRGRQRMHAGGGGFALSAGSLVVAMVLGLLAKETAIQLPLYAFLVEWVVFGFRDSAGAPQRRVMALFALLLFLPGVLGLALLVPWVLDPSNWAAREFTLGTRLLSEARIVIDYSVWTLLPQPQSLSFYHDHFRQSAGWLSPPSTLLSVMAIAALIAAAVARRRQQPLAALGLLLFFAGHMLTATVLPLELIYEHRNYFASLGLLLVVVPLLLQSAANRRHLGQIALALLFLGWTAVTAATAYAWGEPQRLAATLAARAPESPRAQFALGRELMAHSGYRPGSAEVAQAQAVLERAAAMPRSSILPEQLLLLSNSLMQQPLPAPWWDSMTRKLQERAASAEAIAALGALVRCARDGHCALPLQPMRAVLDAAQHHDPDDTQLLSIYSDWAWNVAREFEPAERMAARQVALAPDDVDARIALARMNLALKRLPVVQEQLRELHQRARHSQDQAEIAAIEHDLAQLSGAR